MPIRKALCYDLAAMSSTARAIRDDGGERERVLRILRDHEPELRAHGLTRLCLFGSLARGEAGPKSDVDLLIEVDPGIKFTLVDLAGLDRFVAGLLGRPVEFAFPGRLRERPRIWRRVREDAIDVL